MVVVVWLDEVVLRDDFAIYAAASDGQVARTIIGLLPLGEECAGCRYMLGGQLVHVIGMRANESHAH